MRKVPPILKPIALLTISTIIATATGVVNSNSYRQPSSKTIPTTEQTENTVDTDGKLQSGDTSIEEKSSERYQENRPTETADDASEQDDSAQLPGRTSPSDETLSSNASSERTDDSSTVSEEPISETPRAAVEQSEQVNP